MIQSLLNYLKYLCEQHKDFLHDDNGKIAYYEFDWIGMMAAGRKRNDQILYVHKIKGAYNDNRGDNKTDTAQLIFLIIKKVDQNKMRHSREHMLACKAFGEEFKERMRYDQKNSEEPGICKLLKAVDLDAWTYEQTELQADGWIGVQFRLPFKTDYTTTYNPAKWT